jgi:7,8-dihydropterin-6-yl-methyl-4-(beta-D-ribofuranosyl)aminobenzene 5'-phosphate synthase
MKHVIGLTALGLLLSLSTLLAREPFPQGSVSEDRAVHVTIIYDNYRAVPSLQPDWGFACLVEYQDNQLLFDSGNSAEIYSGNITALGIHPEQIPSLFISHEHGDHTAGMPFILEKNPTIMCYLPEAYAAKLESGNRLPRNFERLSGPTHLYGPFYSTGDQFEAFREQGLVIKTGDGGVLITGCGHPGPVEMVEMAEKELGIEIHTMIGGLHLMEDSEGSLTRIADSLKGLGVKTICPTHCTGDKSIAYLKKSFGEGYISGGTGKEIIIQ